MAEAWYPAAVMEPGPDWKTNPAPRRGKGVVVHSAEGSRSGAMSVLLGPREASWHFTVCKDGTVLQHYAASVQAWHAGARANPLYLGVECEGVAGEALTAYQLGSLAGLVAWMARSGAWPGLVRGETLFEHNEFMATACPSGRVPWAALAEAAGRVPAVPAPAPEPTPRDIAFAGAAAALFAQEGRDLRTLHPYDQGTLRWLAARL